MLTKSRSILRYINFRAVNKEGFIVAVFFCVQRAIQLNPGDSTVRHLLGRWCYAICDVSWVQRQVASAIFATPPSSSYEEVMLCVYILYRYLLSACVYCSLHGELVCMMVALISGSFL